MAQAVFLIVIEVKLVLTRVNWLFFFFRVPETTQEELNTALAAAKKAYKSWSQSTIMTRQQLMFKYVFFLLKNFESLDQKIKHNGYLKPR